MTPIEILARALCSKLGRKPDDTLNGQPLWERWKAEAEAAITALMTLPMADRLMVIGTEPEQASLRCPFEDPDFELHPQTPCPICGDLGTLRALDGESKCVG